MTLEEKRNYMVQLEWDFFQQVQNEGGRADCQNTPHTFYIMRKSQFDAWPETLINCYLNDLKKAKAEGRNPVMEKYAWMMKYTAPHQFKNIYHLLPAVPEENQSIINQILQIQLTWMEEYKAAYPKVSSGNRAVKKEQAAAGNASFETYLWGELCTYSHQTLSVYLDYIKELAAAGKNLVLLTMEYTVEKYGCRNLEEAEAWRRR